MGGAGGGGNAAEEAVIKNIGESKGMAKEKFEEALDKLENIVKEMEAGELQIGRAHV